MAWFKKKQNKQVVPLMNDLIKMLSNYNGGSLGLQNKRALNQIFGRSGYYKMLVSKRGTDVSRVPLYLKDLEGEDDKNITEHPLLDLINKPNTEMVGIQLRKLTQIYYDNIGEWIWWLGRNVAGEVIAIYPLNPADVIVRGSENEKWQFNSVNGVQEIEDKDIIYCKDIDPDQPYGRGSGQGQATSDELSIAEKIMKLIGITFDNKAVPPFIINFKGVSETEVEVAQSKWLNKFKGINNYAKPMFTNADIDIKKLAYNFEETKIVELGEAQRNQFREIWGIPKELIGDLGNSNKASSTNAWNIYAENVVVPNIELFVQTLQYSLVDEYNKANNTNFKLCYKTPNKADEEFVLNVIKANPFAFTANEIRVVAHHDEWEDEKGKIIYMPLNFTASNGNVNRGVASNDLMPKNVEEKEPLTLMSKKKISLIKQEEEEQEDEEAFENSDLIILMLLLGRLTDSNVLDSVTPRYLTAFTESGTKAIEELGSNVEFNGDVAPLKEFMDNTLVKSIGFINEGLTNEIRALLQEGIKTGLTKEQIKDRLKTEVFDEYIKGWKLERIVDTEATAIVNSARLEAMQQSNMNILKEWLTQKDMKVRETHLIDGQTKARQEYFVLADGEQALYPGDPNLSAENRINCRCFLAYNTGQSSMAGETEEQRTAYWNKQRAEVEYYKNLLRIGYSSIFAKLFEDMEKEL